MEILGIIATVLVLFSFLVNGEIKIRIINIFGAILFVTYGVLINAFSVWVLNLCLVFIHIYKLKKIKKQGE